MKSILLLIPALLLFASRLSSQYNPDYMDYMCEETKKPFFRILPNGDGTRTVLPGRKYSHYFKFEVPGKSGKKRIFIIGESAAALLYDNTRENFFAPGLLENFEILDFGMASYDAPKLLEVFREALKLKPDVILVMAGNNGGFSYPCPSPYAALERTFFNLKRRYAGYSGEEKEVLAEYSAERQKNVFLEMARLARSKKVRLFLSVLPVNPFFPPSGTMPGDAGFLKAYKSYADKKYSEAAGLFLELLEKKKSEPFANYYAGKSFYALGKYGEASGYLSAAVRYDSRLDRATDLVNAAIRETAAKEGAGLVDLESYFLSLSRDGVMNEKYFADGAHWLKKYNLQAQAFVFKTLLPSFVIPPVSSREDPEDRNNFLRYAVSYVNNEKSGINERAVYMLDRFLDYSPLPSDFPSKEKAGAFLKNKLWLNLTGTVDLWWCGFLTNFGETLARRGEPVGALKVFQKRETECGSDSYSSVSRALALKRAGRQAEIPSFSGKISGEEAERVCNYARVWDLTAADCLIKKVRPVFTPELSRAESKKYSDAGVEKIAAGDSKGGISSLEKAVEADPLNFEARITLCSVYCRAGRLEEALSSCDKAVEIAGGNSLRQPPETRTGFLSEALSQRALVYEKAGKKERAEKDRLSAVKAAAGVKGGKK